LGNQPIKFTCCNFLYSPVFVLTRFGFALAGVLETTEKGWRTNIFQRIRAVFGYGHGL
jgi:hypothetical protein